MSTIVTSNEIRPIFALPSLTRSLIGNELDGYCYYYYDLNRDKGRKEIKRKRRIINISTKVYHLLLKCDISFLSTISPKEIDKLRQSASLALGKDGNRVEYYPIPKGLNNKIRKFIHNNPLRPGHVSLVSDVSFFTIR